MRKHLSKILLMMAVSGAVALAQATSPQSSSSPDQSASPGASSSSQSASPSTSQYPSSSSSSAGQASSASGSLSQAQSQIQEALTKQMPSSNVTVSTTSDNQLQLSGSVSAQADKQRAEDIAKSAAPGQTVVNNIKVSGSSSDTNPK